MAQITMKSKLAAEFLGTFVLVFGGCGSAIFSARVIADKDYINMGIGLLGVALAFGLTVLTLAYAVGHISGGHFNPAVTLGSALAGRVAWKSVLPYWLIQLVAASAAGCLLFFVASGTAGYDAIDSGFASNGYGERSPDGYSIGAAFVAELVLTAIFVYVILGATDDRAPKGFAPMAIGSALTLIHLISIPITNTSVNPARSIGVVWFAGTEAAGQVWLFILAPLLGAAIAGATYRPLFPTES